MLKAACYFVIMELSIKNLYTQDRKLLVGPKKCKYGFLCAVIFPIWGQRPVLNSFVGLYHPAIVKLHSTE